VIEPSQRSLSEKPQQTNFHATGGIRTRNPGKREAADPRLRLRGHRDQYLKETIFVCFFIKV
jgi:hypothetical protein